MPQPGEHDQWPTTDDDRSSTGPNAELPVPDQQEQQEASAGSADARPAAPQPDHPGPPDQPAPKGDQPHPEPGTGFNWPIAELEQKPERAFARPLPVPSSKGADQPTSRLPIPDRPEEAAQPEPQDADRPTEQAPSPDTQPTADTFEFAPAPKPEADQTGSDDGETRQTQQADAHQDDSASEPDEAERGEAGSGGAGPSGSVRESDEAVRGEAEPKDSRPGGRDGVESGEAESTASRPGDSVREPARPPSREAERAGSRSDGSARERDEVAPGDVEATASRPGDSAQHLSGEAEPADSRSSGSAQHVPGEESAGSRPSGSAREPAQHPSGEAEAAGSRPSDSAQHLSGEAEAADSRGGGSTRESTDHVSGEAEPAGSRPSDSAHESTQHPSGEAEPAGAENGESGSRQADSGLSASASTPVQEAEPTDPRPSGSAPKSAQDVSRGAQDEPEQSAPAWPTQQAESGSWFGGGADQSTPAETQAWTFEPQPRQAPPAPPLEPTRQPQQEAPTSFMRPVAPPRRQPARPTNQPDIRPARQTPADAPTSFMRRPAQDFTSDAETTTFIRRTSEWPPPEPPRAQPERVGPPPREPEQAKRERRPLLITAIALVVVIGVAAGVVFGVPGLSDKLGITGKDAVAIAPPPAPVSYTPGLKAPDTAAPAPTKQGVETVLAGPIADPALGTVTGVVIDPASGQTLYERDAGTAITPASTGKILTAAAALLTLDDTYQLVTKVVEGESPGEAIIVGGGDPTLSSLKPGLESIYPGAAHLSELVDKVKASGAQIQTVYIDQSRYTGSNMASSWLPADVASGYITPIVPAMLDGGRADATVNYSPRTNNPGGVLVDEFATRIGATAPDNAEKKAPANAKVLGEARSAPLVQLIENMLDHSDNVLGEILAHEVAIKTGKEPSFDGASQATLDVLRQNGFNVDGVVLKDGSGLSAEDKVSARVMAEILAVAAGPVGKDKRTARLRPLLGGLPVAGGSGTLADRYNQAGTQEAKGWLRAKTGSLTGVNSLAGIVLDKDNRPLVFAFLTGGTTSTTARPALDRVTAALRGCGCQ